MRLFPVVMVISALGLPALAQEVMPLDQAFVQQRLNAETLKTANDRQELAKNRVSVDTMQKRPLKRLKLLRIKAPLGPIRLLPVPDHEE